MARRFSGVEELAAHHRVAEFDCGSDPQTTWLRDHALQSHASRMAKVYVVTRLADGAVIGYYALSTGAVLHPEAPPRITRGAGRCPVPVVILARLGVDLSEQGQGIGRALVKDAFMRVNAAADIVGVRALLIHAEDDRAAELYTRLAAFERSPTDPLHLMLLIKDLRRSLGQGEALAMEGAGWEANLGDLRRDTPPPPR